MGGRIYDEVVKDKVLEKFKSLSISISDPDRERVIILTKDLSGISDLTYKSLKKKSKKGDDGMEDILKALIANRQPVL